MDSSTIYYRPNNYVSDEEDEEYEDDDDDEEYEYDDEDYGTIETTDKKTVPVEFRYWAIIITHINYLATRKFMYAFPLSFLYELLTLLIMTEKGYSYTSMFLARIILIFIYTTLDIIIHYTFDLTYIAGAYVLYIALVWIITLAIQVLVPMKYIKFAMFVAFLAITVAAAISSIFAEPWVWVVLSSNSFVVFVMVLLISYNVLSEYMALALYLFAWTMVIVIYRYMIGERNDSHDFDHYF